MVSQLRIYDSQTDRSMVAVEEDYAAAAAATAAAQQQQAEAEDLLARMGHIMADLSSDDDDHGEGDQDEGEGAQGMVSRMVSR